MAVIRPDFTDKKSPRTAGTAEGSQPTEEAPPMDATPNIPKLQPIDTEPLTDSLAALERMRLELGTTPAELICGEVEDARVDLMAALKLADKYGERGLHFTIGQIVLAVDDLLEKLAKDHGAQS